MKTPTIGPLSFSSDSNSATGPGSTALPSPSSGASNSEASSAGALLGIHNIYIVLPQFLVSFLSSLVFAAIEPKTSSSPGDPTGDQVLVAETAGNPDTIGVMLRFGGVMAGIAALLSLRLWKQPRSIAPSHT